MASDVVISSDDEAFEWLKKALTEQALPDGITPDNFDFENWPNLSIRLTGDKFHNSLTPTVMRGFVDLQNSIYKSYALAKYGVPDARKLSEEERNEVEIVVTVEEGSSLLEIDIQGLLEKFIETAGTKMDPVHVIIVVLGLGLIWGGTTAYKAYLKNQSTRRQAELRNDNAKAELVNLQELSKQETERLKIISDAMKKETVLLNIGRQAHDGKTDLLKRLAQADTIQIYGDSDEPEIDIEGVVAQELVKNARRRSEAVRLDGLYRILRVDATDPRSFKVKLKSKQHHKLVFDAVVKDSILSAETRQAFQVAEWNRKGIFLVIDARSIDGNIRDATVSEIDPDKSEQVDDDD